MKKESYIEANIRVTKYLLRTQRESELKKIRKKRHIPIMKIVSNYADKDLPLLDVGAREGNLIKLLSKNGFKDLFGIDISEDAIELLKKRGFSGEVADAQDFNLNRKFNTIIASHVLEHCPEANKVVNNLYNHLLNDGILYVEVPRQPKVMMPTNAAHFHHYDELVEFLFLFDLAKWKLLYSLYVRGDNKGTIRAIFKKL